MSNYEGFKRKSTRMAAIEAAKKIKNNSDTNKLLCHDVKQEYHSDEANMVKPFNGDTSDNGVNDINTRRNCRKKKISDQVLNSRNFHSKVQVHNLSEKVVAANPSKHKDMPKRGRGRPPKAQSEKNSFTSNTSMIYEDINDVNVRRESYNTSLLKSESTSPKQLQPGNGGITYRESLMKFCKNLGPTARNIALQKLLGRGVNCQARHQFEPLLSSSKAQPHPRFMDVNSTNSSVRNDTLSQVSQPLIGFGALRTDITADYKGKRIMVDDGKSNSNKWNAGDNLEFLFGKQNPTVKICNNYQENLSTPTGGYGSSENQDFVPKNLAGYGQISNWRSINQIGSFLSNYNGNLTQNINNISGTEDRVGTPTNGSLNSCVHPSTYVQPSFKISSSSLGMNDGVSSISSVPTPLAAQKWCLPPPETKILVLNDGFRREQEFPFALTSYMQTTQQPEMWIENSWAQNQLSRFQQPEPHVAYQQQPQSVQPQQHRSIIQKFDQL